MVQKFVHLQNIDAKCYALDYYDVNVNKYGVKLWNIIKILGK